MSERRSGPDPHFHRTMSESFFVLSGAGADLRRAHLARRARRATSSTCPPGGVHGFRNESGAPVDMLILFAPGAPREGYFEELAEIGASGRTLDDAEWVELWARHDQYPA